MTLYEIPNIEHCNIEEGANWYRVTSHEGWYIHLNNGVEDTLNVWKGAVVLLKNMDFSIVEIRAEADLPPDAEICGSGNDNIDTEVM